MTFAIIIWSISCGTIVPLVAPSMSGLMCTTFAPRRWASARAVIMRGALDPAFTPMISSSSASSQSCRSAVPLPVPREAVSARPEASWHMLEQSGRLLVPNSRAHSWYMKVASLLSRPEV